MDVVRVIKGVDRNNKITTLTSTAIQKGQMSEKLRRRGR